MQFGFLGGLEGLEGLQSFLVGATGFGSPRLIEVDVGWAGINVTIDIIIMFCLHGARSSRCGVG